MQLREIHIDGFGILHDRRITGLSAGLNIIYGPNEFGKSTLLAFIRRILFGFPTGSSSANLYPALDGGTYGGRLKCQLADGKTITIARKKGTHGGSVTTDGEPSNSDEIRKFFNNISKTFYENVYAIGLEELENNSFLATTEVKDQLYSASLGLGNITLTAVKKIFNDTSDSIFKASGRSQKIPEIYEQLQKLEKSISDIQRSLSEYDDLVQKQGKLTGEIGILDSQIKEYQDIVRSLEHKNNLFPVYINLTKSEVELSRLPEVPQFTPNSLSYFEQMERDIKSLQEEIDKETDLLKELETKNRSLVFNEQIITNEPTVLALQKVSDKYKSAVADIDDVTSKRSNLAIEVQKEVEKIGQGWTLDSIKSFELSHLHKDKIDSYKEYLQTVQRKIDNTRAKLDSHIEAKAAEQSRRFSVPPIYKYVIYFITAISLIGIFTGFFLSQFVSIFAGVFLVIGIFALIFMRNANWGVSTEQLEKKLTEELNSAYLEQEKLNTGWQEFLGTLNLSPELTPDGTLNVFNAIKMLQLKIKSLDELNNRISNIKETIDSVKELYNKVTSSLDKKIISGEITADIGFLFNGLEQAKQTKQSKDNLTEPIEQSTRKIATLNKQKNKADVELIDYLSSHCATDKQDFRLKFDTFKKRDELKGQINKLETTIQAIIGTGDRYSNFKKSLAETNKDEIESQINEASSKLGEWQEKQKQKNREIGEKTNMINQLSSSEELLKGQEELEIKKQQLRDYSRDWTRAQIALFILDKATSKYENTRQPRVIESASEIFAIITDGEYPKIIKPLESDEFTIYSKNDYRKSINQMSRGTMEQLLLALRLGLIKVYEDQAEPMPIIMDDIMVNFDDNRGPLAIKALAEFAKNRQVIILTCHKNMLATYKKSGAREITFC